VATLFGACVTPTPPPDPGSVEISEGHVDIGLAVEDGELEPHLHDHEADAEYAPDEALLVAGPAAITTVPADPAFSFLGSPGAAIHVLPQDEAPGVLALGIGAEEIEPGVLVDDEFDIEVTAVDGPGAFSIYTVDGLGAPDVWADSGDGLPDTIADLGAGSHSHANFAFTAPGIYSVDLRFTTTLVDGGVALDSGPVTFTFDVRD
jgi:surface-anchored protein